MKTLFNISNFRAASDLKAKIKNFIIMAGIISNDRCEIISENEKYKLSGSKNNSSLDPDLINTRKIFAATNKISKIPTKTREILRKNVSMKTKAISNKKNAIGA